MKEKTCLDCRWCEYDSRGIMCAYLERNGILFLPIYITDKFNSSDTCVQIYLAEYCQTFEDKKGE